MLTGTGIVCMYVNVYFFKEDFKCIETWNVEFSEELSRPQYSPSSSLTHGQPGLMSFLPTSYLSPTSPPLDYFEAKSRNLILAKKNRCLTCVKEILAFRIPLLFDSQPSVGKRQDKCL